MVEVLSSPFGSGRRGGAGGGRGAYSSVAYASHFTIDQVSLPRRSTVPTPNGDTYNAWALITLFPCIPCIFF